MPGVAQLIAVAVLVILAAVVLTFAWRATRWTLRTRRILTFRTAITDLTGRAESHLAAISARIDAVRRSSAGGAEIIPELAEAMTVATGLTDEARALRGPAGTEAIRAGIADELERVVRALETVEHGCRVMAEGRGREFDPEAQTAIKRGYLNLLHARESIAEHAAAAAALPVTIARFLGRRTVD